LTDEEAEWLANNKNLYVSIKPGWAPVSFLSEHGEFRGISIDLLNKIEQILGIKFTKIQAKEDIFQEKSDVILATTSAPLAKQSNYSLLDTPYLVSPFVIYTKKGIDFKDLNSLHDKKVAVFRTGPVAKNLADYHPRIHLYAADIAEEALEALISKKVDAYIGNSIIIDYTMINQGFRDINASGITPYKSEIYMAVKAASPLLASSLNKAINHISAEERKNITDSWTLKATKNVDINYKLIFSIILVASTITFALYNANRTLNKEIKQRKIVELSLIEERNRAEEAELIIRQYSNELKTLNENLEEKISDRTLDLEVEIEERKNTEKILRETQNTLVETEKMASLGNLVAGIAHEVNTPLGIGVTAVTHLKEKSLELIHLYNSSAIKRSNLESYFEIVVTATKIIEENLSRASELIRSFKEVSVDQTGGDVREINLLNYIKQILMSLQHNYKKSLVSVDISNINENLILKLQPGALSQVMSNLLLNSLAHGFEENQVGLISISAQISENNLMLLYEDNGKGVPKENLRKIFEPFFSTKRGSGGSGLGMHIVYNIITQKFNGKIDINSDANQGVKFEILIPNCVRKV
jgi:signal transduction histidine kinase